MKDMSKETSLRPKEIFDFVCRSNPLVGSHITYSSMRTILHRIRNSCFPPIPNSMAELKDSLLKYEAVKEIYKGHVISTNNEIAIIFSTDILLVALAASTEIYVDGTFSTVPRFPHVAQMYTIHIRYMETNIAAIYILCEKRTKSMYNAIWKKIKELAPDFQKNLQFIMTDYEAAAILSMNENFPQSKIHGCWFHFNQFLKYMTDTWLPIADKVSTFGCPVRTNNAVESFHNIAAQKLRKPHANIWIFLDNLKKLIIDQEIDYFRVREDLNPRRTHRRINRERNTKIANAQTALTEGRLPLQQFLRMFHTFNKQFLHREMNGEMKDDNIANKENEYPAVAEIQDKKNYIRNAIRFHLKNYK
ncbi:hypothetical protein CAJAP_08408 [Camponotus japonicus]